jgi:hypothetical protein
MDRKKIYQIHQLLDKLSHELPVNGDEADFRLHKSHLYEIMGKPYIIDETKS